MPYRKRKQDCTQSDGDKGKYVLSYTTKKGEKRSACHTSEKNMQGQIAAIEAEADETTEEVLEETIRNLVKEALLQEAGDRGFVYEATLINALQSAGVDVTPAAGNNSSISDLGFNIDGVDIGAEVKLGHGDNLGAIRKNNFSSLTWDGNTFTGAPSSNSEMPDVINALISSMNSSPKVKARFKELEAYIVPFRPLPWDLKSSFGNDKGNENESGLYAVLRNEPERFPIPSGATPVKRKQIATPGDGVANIDQATLLQIMSGKSAPNGAPTSYVIVGNGPGSESTVAGQIYSLGSDPLGINAPVYAPGNVGVDIRFAGAGSSKSSRRYSFNFKTKATSPANSGIPFSNTEELMTILEKPLEENAVRKYTAKQLNESTEEVLEETIRMLVREAIVSFEGIDYDIPDEEVEPIKNQIEFGSADPEPANSRVFDSAKAIVKLKQLMGEKYQEVANKVNVYLPDTKAEISKVLVNNPALFADTVFTVSPSLGLKGSVPAGPEWVEMINVHRPGRSKAVGRGEIALALLLQGVTPDSGSGVHDLNLSGIGEIHVKEVASSGGMRRPDVPMGKNISGTDKQAPWAQSLDGTTAFDGKALTETMLKSSGKAILDKFAEIQGSPAPVTIKDYNDLADAWQENFIESFLATDSWGGAAGVAFIDKETGEYQIVSPNDAAPSRISDNKWRVSTKAAMGERWSGYFKKYVPKQLNESALRRAIGDILKEDLTGSDKSEIKRMIKKELDGPSNRREVDKAFKKNFDKELKKALGSSFFGSPGKINKFVIDEIHKEVLNSMDSKASKDMIILVCKAVIKKLYRELSFSSPQIIDRINPKV